MNVKLLSYTQNPKEVIYAAAKQCYAKGYAGDVFEKAKNTSFDKVRDFIAFLIDRGHWSTLEHVSFTFAIEGISRVCTHQLVRHRLASYSQQSQRYVNMDDFQYIVPPIIEQDSKAKAKFLETIDYIKKAYEELKTILAVNKNLDNEAINQDARFILPQASETKIVITMNCRELMHFFAERTCLRAQWEIRAIAVKMQALCKDILPEVFIFAGPKCKQRKYCPEHSETCPLNSTNDKQ